MNVGLAPPIHLQSHCQSISLWKAIEATSDSAPESLPVRPTFCCLGRGCDFARSGCVILAGGIRGAADFTGPVIRKAYRPTRHFEVDLQVNGTRSAWGWICLRPQIGTGAVAPDDRDVSPKYATSKCSPIILRWDPPGLTSKRSTTSPSCASRDPRPGDEDRSGAEGGGDAAVETSRPAVEPHGGG